MKKLHLPAGYVLLSIFIFSVSFAGNWIFEKKQPVIPNTESYLLPGGDDDKPAEEVYKNIQVLKGMPKKDLHMVMHFMRASLGVNCAFCHVHNEKTNEWNWESDDKEEKGTARKMITMVRGINKDYFEGFNAISCNSCHNGKTSPVRTPPLPQLPSNFKEFERDTTLPAADAVFNNYYKALGDRSKLTNAASRYSKGTVKGFDGKSFDIEIYQQPGKYLQVVSLPEGPVSKGYDGVTGWQKNSKGVTELYDFQTAQARDFSNLYQDLDFTARYQKMMTVGVDTVNGRPSIVIRATIDENKFDRLDFDRESGLLLRRKTNTKSIIGNIPEQVEYSDYKMTDGVMIPFSVHYSYIDPWMETYRIYSEVKLNSAMDNVSFSKPQ